ncbi:uracil DNA N-glycosylase Ung1, putative [Paecilomyces variotii No. 5]|uniref:Uracil-DNA glycosylase n=1 Tax=Byssochlamys spectabilis (strain No. 5 / NBRC 109023) TaxID=1356009 RepID=V5G9G2_BYSSN|nr:uracil DNA N-glycosylase Ung1, putative [Paecilomyces variotii No. 5]
MSNTLGVKRNANHLSSSPDSAKKPKANGSITSFFGAPKPRVEITNGSSSPTVSKFNKDKWVASLTPEQKELLQLEIDTLDVSWLAHLKDELVTPEFLNLKRFLKKEKDAGVTVFPPEKDIYSWSRHTPLHTVKAVIVGQDPYHNYNQAHGLCFSVRPPTPAPPSLANIYIALKNDYPSFKAPSNKGGLLTPWAERGVLMLNTCLTVRVHAANSHQGKGWERFTQKCLDTVAKVRTRGVVFLAWGNPAGKRVAGINRDRHCVLQCVHPSPLSARNGFFTCGHFKKCNEWLTQRYGEDGPIDWALTEGATILPKKSTTTVTASAAATSTSTDGEKKTVSESKTTATSTTTEKDAKPQTSNKSGDIFDDEDDLEALEALAAAAAESDKDKTNEKSTKENVPPETTEATPSQEGKEEKE